MIDSKSLSILLGLHDRSKKSEPNRCSRHLKSFQMIVTKMPLSFLRKKVQVDEIFVHMNYSTNGGKENDIALLRLGENLIKSFTKKCSLIFFASEERVDLHKFTPACFPNNSSSLDGSIGHIYGTFVSEYICLCATNAIIFKQLFSFMHFEY